MINSRYALIPSEGEVVFAQEQLSDPAAGQLLLKAKYSSISLGTEHTLMSGNILPLPQRLGYSMVAEVVAVGEDAGSFREGDFVVTTATHANYLLVDHRACTPIPADVDLQQAAFFNLAHTAMYALRRSGLQLGEACLVMGQGVVGSITAQLAKLAGASPLVVTDLDESRLQTSRAMGITNALNGSQEEELQSLLNSMDTGGFNVVFEATGLLQPLKQAFDLIAERGRIVMMSQSRGENLPNFSHQMFLKGATFIGGYINSKPYALYRSDLQIADSWPPKASERLQPYRNSDSWTSDADIRVIMRLIQQGSLDLQPLITHRFSWRDLPGAYESVWRKDSTMLGGLIDWTE